MQNRVKLIVSVKWVFYYVDLFGLWWERVWDNWGKKISSKKPVVQEENREPKRDSNLKSFDQN